jgi:hypothetical protein
MDRRLRAMLDHYEITQTLAEYCRGCDRCDEGHMASVYLADSWDDHGYISAPGPEFARMTTARMLAETQSVYHVLGQSLIKVDGDHAGAETYFIAVTRDQGEDGREMCNQLGGRFVDRLERIAGLWRIKSRTVLRDWSVSLPIEHDFVADAGLKDGARSGADHSYGVLSRTHGADWAGRAGDQSPASRG